MTINHRPQRKRQLLHRINWHLAWATHLLGRPTLQQTWEAVCHKVFPERDLCRLCVVAQNPLFARPKTLRFEILLASDGEDPTDPDSTSASKHGRKKGSRANTLTKTQLAKMGAGVFNDFKSTKKARDEYVPFLEGPRMKYERWLNHVRSHPITAIRTVLALSLSYVPSRVLAR